MDLTAVRLTHCPTDWQFSGTGVVNNIDVKGFIFPKLSIQWNDIQIINIQNSIKVQAPATVI